MARTARVISSTGIYAVMLRGNTDVFADDDMREAFLAAAEKYIGDGLLGIRFSDNRVDMLIEESEKGISMDMKPLTTSFARTYNREMGLDGKVFADRFKSVPVEDDETQAECIHYLNGGDLALPYMSAREAQGKAPAEKKFKPKKKTKSVKSTAPKPAKKKAVTSKPKAEKEPEKKEEAAPVRRRNDLPSWLL